MSDADRFLARFQAMTKSHINEIYNDVAEKNGVKRVNRFADKAAAIRRTRILLVRFGLEPASILPPGQNTPKKRQKVFRYPPETEIKQTRAGFLRDRAKTMLLGGATFGMVSRMIGEHDTAQGGSAHNTEQRAYELIRSLHSYCGWGLREEARDGEEPVIFIWAHANAKLVGGSESKRTAGASFNGEYRMAA